MRRPSVDDMLANRTTRYSLVIAVAKRAREISADVRKKEQTLDEKPVLLAIEEFKKHKFNILEPDINE
ncbi:MAG: DNA-directed RNA polymerase subunit omega [Clostridia bacterium]|nr:DNA-directed RNA polymerase subunit omega [Clostridia bacterium]